MALQINPQQILQSLRYQDARNPTEAEIGIRSRWLESFPDQEANVLSYQDNPACKCGGDIQTAMAKDAYTKLKINLAYIFGEPAELVLPRAMFGEVMVVADDAAYKQVILENQRLGNFFRGISVVVDVVNGAKVLKLYFW